MTDDIALAGALAGAAKPDDVSSPESSTRTLTEGARDSDVQKSETGRGEVEAIDVTSQQAAAQEASPSLPVPDEEKGRSSGEAPMLVTWDSVDSLEDPQNWSRARKWSVVLLVSSSAFMVAVGSSVIAPALPLMADEFGVRSDLKRNLMLSIYVLALAFGPLVLAPVSEVYGRTLTLHITNAFFIVFCVACCLAQSYPQILAFRFLTGLGGSATLVVGGGSISDMFSNDKRGSALSLYSMGPLLGPCVGPIIGGFIVQELAEWRWCMAVVAMAAFVSSLLGLALLRESYPPRILSRKAARLCKETGDGRYTTRFEIQDRQAGVWAARFKRHIQRPVVMISTQPLVAVFSAYSALLYGTLYILITTFDSLFVGEYGMRPGVASLNYLSLSIGCLIGSITCGRMTDLIYVRLRHRNNGVGLPEYKLPIMFLLSFTIPLGMLIYGWTAQRRTHWIGPDVGAAIFTFGMMSSITVRAYLVDCYQLYAASVLSANNLARNVAGFALPLAAPALFGTFGFGWGSSVIALTAAVIGIPAPFLFWRYGAALRARSTYARDTA